MRLVSLSLAVFVVGCGRQGIDTSTPVIDVQPLALDFGPVPTGLNVSLPVQVRNLGRVKLTLQAATTTGDFTGKASVVEAAPNGPVCFSLAPRGGRRAGRRRAPRRRVQRGALATG